MSLSPENNDFSPAQPDSVLHYCLLLTHIAMHLTTIWGD